MVVAERAGCDRDPIDATGADGQLALLGYIWPDQADRFKLLRGAFEVASRVPAPVEQADALAWIAGRLADSRPGMATVVFHSIVVQYFTPVDAASLTALLDDAGARATRSAPLAWLRLEPNSQHAFTHAELRLTVWPSGEERLLARAGFHGTPVRWGP